jgi:hypothetical protein
MKIEINKEIVSTFKEMGIKTDQLGSCLIAIECMMSGNYDLLDVIDDKNTNKNFLTIYKELELAGVFKKSTESEYHFSMDDDGIELMEILRDAPEIKIEPVNPDAWIAEYRSLWINEATGNFYITPDKRSLGGSIRDLTQKMKKFLSDYRDTFSNLPDGLTPEKVVIEATKNYISEFKKVHFAFAKDAYNFIYKQEGQTKDSVRSLLATACENYISGYSHVPTGPVVTRSKSIN